MRRKRAQEEQDNPDRWVVSYADFITLLFAFFTTLYALSHVDLGKLERFSGSVKSALKTRATASENVVIDGIRPVNYEDAGLEKEMRSLFEKSGIINDVLITRGERGVSVSFGDSVLFEPGSAEIKAEARPLLLAVEAVIRKTQDPISPISIEGHTDNMPIRNSWELSTARAVSVLMSLLQDSPLHPERFSASGYGEYRPVASNAAPEGRARNRRVDIVFVSGKEGT
jgi:chemotaxis protein MotB